VTQFLRNAWYVAMWAENLAPEQLVPRTILGEPLVFFRAPDGTASAIEDRCPHRFAPLSRGRWLPSGRIQCGYHGLEIDGSGACVYNPHGNHHIPPAARIESYPLVERDSLLWIWMGDREPDAAAVPDFSPFGNDVPALHVGWRDYINIKAGYRLVMDNLLDSSHVNYVHEGILGNEEMIAGRTTFVEEGNSVTITRASEGVPVPGMYKPLFPNEDSCDKWVDTTWYPPSAIILKGGVQRLGASREDGTGIYGAHLVTPETETTTHYHFSSSRWNVLTQGDDVNAGIRESLSQIRRFAFEEQDGPLIEAQQRVVERLAKTGEVRPALLAVDVGSVRRERILQALIAGEHASIGEVR
jgi:phenylpropionate dioxygenase-like ring-hydroxylating dioxygenase large terminal subunit